MKPHSQQQYRGRLHHRDPFFILCTPGQLRTGLLMSTVTSSVAAGVQSLRELDWSQWLTLGVLALTAIFYALEWVDGYKVRQF